MLAELAAPQTKWTFLCQYAPFASMECLKQSQLQRDVGCQTQTQSVPSPKMRWILIILKESQTSCWQFAQGKSKPYWVVATLQISAAQTEMCPQPQFTGNLRASLFIAGTRGRMKHVCHRHLAIQAWVLQCWANGKKGLFSNSLPLHCRITRQCTEEPALAAPPCFMLSPWAPAKAMACECTCKK